MTGTPCARPTAHSERIQVLDILRGFAIFGIFVVNVEIMNCVFMNGDAFGAQWTGQVDVIASKLKMLFFYSKFFPIFSLLFGVGISIQLVSMKRKGTKTSFFYRRMFALFLFGVAHILFLWSGDVIHLYALLGLITLALTRVKPKYLLIAAILLLLFPFYNQLSEFLMTSFSYVPESYLSNYTPEDIRTNIRSGSYLDGMLLRVQEYKSNVAVLYVHLMPVAMAMFLLGLFIGKKRYLKNISHYINMIKSPVLVTAIISNVYRVVFLFFTWETEVWRDPFWREVLIYFMEICDTLMALFFVWIIAYLAQFNFWVKLLKPLRHVGRMALTNYLLQSFIGLLLFSSIGLGLYETLSPSATLGLAAVVFVCQIFLSKLWLTYFLFGPLEWVWRCVSYWQFLPFKK